MCIYVIVRKKWCIIIVREIQFKFQSIVFVMLLKTVFVLKKHEYFRKHLCGHFELYKILQKTILYLNTILLLNFKPNLSVV